MLHRSYDDPTDATPPKPGQRSDAAPGAANFLVGITMALLLIALAVIIVLS